MNEFLTRLMSFALKSGMTESYIEVLDILKNLRDAQSEVYVRFQGDNALYPSKVTALNAKHKIMVVENAAPTVPANLMPGRPLTITTQKQGREIILASRFLEPLTPDFSLGYQVSIPQALGAQLPRGAFRVMLDNLSNQVSVRLQGDDSTAIEGVARNISNSGLGLKTYGDIPVPLTQRSQVVDCRIQLQKEAEIGCKMEIRNVQAAGNGKPTTFIGGRMLDLSRRDASLLKEFIAELKRQHFEVYA